MNFVASKIRWILKGQDGTSAVLQALLSKFSILSIGIITSIINARFLGADGRGEQAAILALGQFIPYLVALGLPVSLIYNLRRYPNDGPKLFGAAVLLGSGLGIVGGLLGALAMPYWLNKYPPGIIFTAQLFMIGVPFSTISSLAGSALEGRGDFNFANKTRPIPLLITMGVMIVCASSGKLTPATSALAYFLPNIVLLCWTLLYLLPKIQPSFTELKASCYLLLNYGIRAYGIDVLVTLSTQIDQVLVVGLLPPASMGLYVVALSLSRTLNVFQQSIVMILFPKVAARSIPEVVASVGQSARLGLATISIAGIAAIIVGQLLLTLLYGHDFSQAVPVFRILIIEAILSGTVQVLVQAFMALERPGIVTISQIFGLSFTVPLMMLLIPNYGLIGTGLSLMGSSIIRLAFIMICFPVVLKVPSPRLIMNRNDLKLAMKLFKREI